MLLAHHFPALAILFAQVLFGGWIIENLHVLAVPFETLAGAIGYVAEQNGFGQSP